MIRRFVAVAALTAGGTVLGVAPVVAGATQGNSPAEGVVGAAAASKVIVVRGHNAAFASPSGNLVCLVYGTRRGESIRCEAIEHRWSVPAKPKSCEYDYGDGLTLDGGRGALLCASDTMREAAQLSRKPETAWFSSRRDVVVRERDGLGAMAGLRYGYALRVGAMQCTSSTRGITCRNLVTRHGFWMSRTAYRTW